MKNKKILNSSKNSNKKKELKKGDKSIIDKNTFENKKDHFNPSQWLD